MSDHSHADHRVYNEEHRSHRTGWLRAAVLGANDGIVSTSSLIIGVAAAGSSREAVLLAGIAGLVAGAMSMAAGEYVSVSSQADTEEADLALEEAHLEHNFKAEFDELVQIYVKRGLDASLAAQVARQLMDHDALATHAREELGIEEDQKARPFLAAWTSALAFTVGAFLPWLAAWLAPVHLIWPVVAAASVVTLMLLGVLSAKAGGAPIGKAIRRITLWGIIAMLATAAISRLAGVAV